MKKSIVKRILFICLLVLSFSCFSYLSVYGADSIYTVDGLEYSTDMQSNAAMSNVNGMKDVAVKILKIMMLKL